MRLPFAVYTAQQGYGWACGLEHGRAALERYRKALGKFPEADYGQAMTRGAVNSDDTVVAYRFLTAANWDSKGRNALYLAMTFFPRTDAGEIDIEHLLGMEVFTKPMREPPPSLEYCGGGSSGSGYDPDTGGGANGVDLACAGSVFQKAFTGTLKIWRSEGESGFRCTYTPPAPVNAVPPVVSGPAIQPAGAPVQALGVQGSARTTWWRRWGEAAAAAAMVALAAGYVVLMKPELFRIEKARPVRTVPSDGGKPVSWCGWPVGPDGRWRGLRDIPPYGACREVTGIQGGT